MQILETEEGDYICVRSIHGDVYGSSASLVSNVLIGVSPKQETHKMDSLEAAGVMQRCSSVLIHGINLVVNE